MSKTSKEMKVYLDNCCFNRPYDDQSNLTNSQFPPSTIDLLSRGMACLVKNMGIVEAECFIAAVQRERFDYTKWERKHFDDVDLHSFVHSAAEYAKSIGK